MIVNTHATFRWRHGLFYAFDYDQMQRSRRTCIIVLVDNVDRVHWRLTRDGHADHTLKDLMVWREEEMLATELLGQIVGCARHGRPHVASAMAGRRFASGRTIRRPAASQADLPAADEEGLSQLSDDAPQRRRWSRRCAGRDRSFRRETKRHFTCFDPGDLEEKFLCKLALDAAWRASARLRPGRRARASSWTLGNCLTSSRTSMGRFTPATSNSSTSRT